VLTEIRRVGNFEKYFSGRIGHGPTVTRCRSKSEQHNEHFFFVLEALCYSHTLVFRLWDCVREVNTYCASHVRPNPNKMELSAQHGRVVVHAVTPRTMRVRFIPNGVSTSSERTWAIVGANGEAPYCGFARDAITLSSTAYALNEEKTRLETEFLRVSGNSGSLELCYQLHNGTEWHELTRDHPQLGYAFTGNDVLHHLVREREERYYGFGEKSGELDKHHRRMSMRATDALAYDAQHCDPLYKSVPFYISMRPSSEFAYGIFYDTTAEASFDLGCEIDNYYTPFRRMRAAAHSLDFYVMAGSLSQVLVEYARLCGFPVLPPRWTTGFLGR
jgi:alpha-glucosidase